MRADIRACDLPAGSWIAECQAGADFADSYRCIDPRPEHSALQSYLALSANTPGWMHALMAVRNQAVRLVGLKHLGSFRDVPADKPAADYRPGERVGIFSLIALRDEEVILCDDDKHLRVQLSLYKAGGQVWLSTVVHEHNRLGWLYMGVVGPVHRLIVPRLLAQGLRRP